MPAVSGCQNTEGVKVRIDGILEKVCNGKKNSKTGSEAVGGNGEV